jgi:hypothetical protein
VPVLIPTDDVYPDSHLKGLATAFVGFCGGFDGRQDCAHIAAAGLEAVCVDRSARRLEGMRELYPSAWQFVVADVYAYADMRYAQGARFDVVSLDPYTNQFQECADHIDLWCSLARVVVIIGTGRQTHIPLPDGWFFGDQIRRSGYQGGTFWTLLGRVST